jgi:ribulose-5-phosphate 4-epimerase/fuculose-1-phosphate aldolase
LTGSAERAIHSQEQPVTTVHEPATQTDILAASAAHNGGRELRIATPAVFDSVTDERAHRKAKLAAAFRMFSKAGLDEGVAGHITVRDPEHPDTYWVNPFGLHFSLVRSSDLVRVDEDGEVVEGDRAVNAAAVAIHCAVHAARPDVVAAAHAHGPYGKTLSALEAGIEPLTQDSCAFYRDFGVYDQFTGVVLDQEEGRRIGVALGEHKAVILRNHGMLTVGSSVDSAAWWFLTLERTAQSQLLAYSAAAGIGRPPRQIGPAEAALTFQQVGSESAGWFQFQPIWERVSRDNPDLFD